MAIKRKHLIVVLFSSFSILVVIVSTLAGYSLYVQWKEDSFAGRYRNSIYRLTAEIFKNDIEITNMFIKAKDTGLSLEGKLKNNSPKTIISIMLELSFSRPDGSVVYRDWFYPLAEGISFGSPFFSSVKRAGGSLLPGEKLQFRHTLRNCPHEILLQFFTKSDFAKTGSSEENIKHDLSIVGVSVV